MRPLSSEAALGHVVTVIATKNHDGRLIQTEVLELIQNSPHGMIHPTKKPEISAHVTLVLLGSIPSPKKAIPI